ncbi:JPT1 isoform 4 [Pan troglodytes]|uniref:Jupiter microtubule associated homolog 1 n=3 Tax=Hominidae TaxID=9604 RepID=F2Z3M5_HUMAN|nr:JPT1 isoform 4 [Pan troglodytes]PNJ87755.1 JPT1 isoform 4 [Pongo abelii]
MTTTTTFKGVDPNSRNSSRDTGSCHVAQAGLELLGSSDDPALAS